MLRQALWGLMFACLILTGTGNAIGSGVPTAIGSAGGNADGNADGNAALGPLIWFQADFPPYVILGGSEEARGIDNQIMATMIARLPEYDHQFRVASYSRILKELENCKPAIVTPLFRTPEREKYVHYSTISSYLVLPNGFIYHKDERSRFDAFILADGSIDLEALCRSGRFKLGISAGRSYFGIIDEMIRKPTQKGLFYERTDSDQLGTLRMVLAKRVDAVFGFPVEIKFGGFQSELRFLRVAKMVPYIPVYFGAPDNEWGLALVEKLDAILGEPGTLERFAGFYRYWLDEEIQPYYDQLRHAYHEAAPLPSRRPSAE